MASEYKPNLGVIPLDVAAITLNFDAIAGTKLMLDRAAGVVVTLPPATGTGATYEFFIKTTVTSNAYDIRCPAGSEFFGTLTLHQDAAATVATFDAADNDTEISMNGTTTGGVRGGKIVVTDLYAGHYHVVGEMPATGTEATPFTTV